MVEGRIGGTAVQYADPGPDGDGILRAAAKGLVTGYDLVRKLGSSPVSGTGIVRLQTGRTSGLPNSETGLEALALVRELNWRAWPPRRSS